MNDALKYSTLIFDMDGTILDTLEDLNDSMNHALAVCGFPERSLDETRTFVGNGLYDLAVRSVPEGTAEDDIRRVHAEMMSWYPAHSAIKTRPYEGVCGLIRECRGLGLKCGLVSNKADGAVQMLCRDFFEGLFDAAVGEREGIRRKPAPDSCFEVMKELGAVPDQTVYIGDSEGDVKTAANAGIDCIAVTWGFRSREQLVSAGAKVFADSPADVLRLITGE